MLAIIDFSTNFKRFLELYEQKERRNYTVENFTTVDEGSVRDSQENKAENGKVDEVSKSKPNRAYILAIIAVVLLVIFGIILTVYL